MREDCVTKLYQQNLHMRAMDRNKIYRCFTGESANVHYGGRSVSQFSSLKSFHTMGGIIMSGIQRTVRKLYGIEMAVHLVRVQWCRMQLHQDDSRERSATYFPGVNYCDLATPSRLEYVAIIVRGEIFACAFSEGRFFAVSRLNHSNFMLM